MNFSLDPRAFPRIARWLSAATVASMAVVAFAARAQDAPEGAADPQDKIICKRFIETGSLVRSYRECKAKRDWERARMNIRSPALTSGGCSSAESGTCLGSNTIGTVTTAVPN